MSSIHPHWPTLQANEQPEADPPPSSVASFPARAFGYGTPAYWQFMDLLVSGLREYERRTGGNDHAPSPLSAA